MKNVFQRVVIGLVVCAGLSGCGDAEVEFEDPEFEIGVEFDSHEMVFDCWGNVVTPKDEWPRIIPTFHPCYFKIVEKPGWISLEEGYYDCDSDYWTSQLKCKSNYSAEPRSGVVKVVVSNVRVVVSREVPGEVIDLDMPVYRFEGEFTFRQEGRVDSY